MTTAHHEHHHDPAMLVRLAADPDFWDERYRVAPAIWSGDANAALVAEASDLAPGSALDVGSGEGGDALWLAGRGWTVTGVDVSQVALDRAAEHARAAGVEERTGWLRADLVRDDLPGEYDLVTTHFVQLPADLRTALHRRLAAAVRPGGTLLVVGHDFSDVENGVPRPPASELFFTAADVAAVLDPAEWTVEVAEARPRPFVLEGDEITIHDAILSAKRH